MWVVGDTNDPGGYSRTSDVVKVSCLLKKAGYFYSRRAIPGPLPTIPGLRDPY